MRKFIISNVIFISLIITGLSPVFAATYDDLCAHPTGDCDFYVSCLEDQLQCGASGYPLGYGHKYCEKFSSETHLSAQGQIWMERTRQCLQEALVPYTAQKGDEQTCGQLMDDAFNSHPRCYTLPDSSICHLPIPDVLQICQTIGGTDLLSFRGLKQIDAVAKSCVLHLQLHPYQPLNGVSSQSHLEFWKAMSPE